MLLFCRLACVAVMAVTMQETLGSPSLVDALDFLATPCRFRLEYRTTLIRNDASCFLTVRQFLKDQELLSGGSSAIDAVISEIRASSPVASPEKPPSQYPLYVGATTQYNIAYGRTRFLQEMIEDVPSMPVVLRSTDVALLYNRPANRVDFVDPSDNMDLRTLESMMSPLPLSSIAKSHWLSMPSRVSRIDESETLAVIDGGSSLLFIKCSSEQPYLPVACWTRDGQSSTEKRLACFVSYQSIDGLLQIRSIFAVRESPEQVRVDEYAFYDLKPIARDDEIVLRVAPAPDLVDRTGGRGKSRIEMHNLPRDWSALFSTNP